MRCIPTRRRRGAFTLVEIMIAVIIIGLLAALAIPAFARTRRAAQSNRFISDLRTFAQAFESYSMQNGSWPPNAGSGVVPSGMSEEFRAAAWQSPTSVGGRWNWDRNNNVAAGISATNVTASEEQMAAIDAKIDDGDLSTGLFRKFDGRYTFVLEP